MRHLMAPWAVLLFVLGAACTKEPLPEEESGPYVPPEPVQLTPPEGVVLEPGDPPFVQITTAEERYEMPVAGNAYRPIQMIREGDTGRYRLALVVDNDNGTVELAGPDFHILPTGATNADGTMMICWNTLTGETSEYSPIIPDPARGMALHCRTYSDGALGAIERIRVPTVGCWIRRVVALPDGSFRLLFKGDDGWFEAGTRPEHGVYEAYFRDRWSTPTLLLPVPTIDSE